MIRVILQVLSMELHDYLEMKREQRLEEELNWKRNRLRLHKEQEARDLDIVDKATGFRRDFD